MVHSQNPVLRFRKKTKNTSQKVFISLKWLCSQDANESKLSLASFNHKPYGPNLLEKNLGACTENPNKKLIN